MAYGDHIYVNRGFYFHHGIDLGDGTVIHFASIDGTKQDAAIRQATLEVFAGGGTVENRTYGQRFSPEDAVARAQSLLGQSGYNLFANNCEHFATWCIAGEHSSAQVEAAASRAGLVGVGAVVPPLGLAIVTGVGEAAALSGPNLMSGLATVGGTVVGGLIVLGGTAGLLASGMMCLALRDKPMLPEDERKARRLGRYGSVGGAAIGVGVAIHTVGALGATGFSAIGLTTGLKTFGGLIAGGMAEGVMSALVTPALLAVGIGYLTYRVAKWALQPHPSAAVSPTLAIT